MRCEKLKSFPKLYSDLRIITTNLRTANSIAVSDDSYLKALISGAINVEELQQNAKDFLKEEDKTYSKIMDIYK